jgi:hypothetical protein
MKDMKIVKVRKEIKEKVGAFSLVPILQLENKKK